MYITKLTKEIVQPGDILHCTSNSFLARAIQFFTKSRINHTALVIDIWGELYIIDAQKDGVNPRKFENWVNNYNYKYKIHRNISGKFDLKSFCIKAISKSGSIPYDFKSLLIYQPIYILTGKWIGKKDPESQKRMYCSEYAAWVLGLDKYWELSPEHVFEILSNDKDYKLLNI